MKSEDVVKKIEQAINDVDGLECSAEPDKGRDSGIDFTTKDGHKIYLHEIKAYRNTQTKHDAINYLLATLELEEKELTGKIAIFAEGRYVKINGKEYILTPQQAQVVNYVYEQHQLGCRWAPIDKILESVGIPDSSRLKDTFKSNRDAYEAILMKCPKSRDMIGLNL
jgi:hypothetical protein